VVRTSTYLDYAATTPTDERVIAAMLPFFGETFGNPSSIHYFGQRAEAGLEQARERVARSLGAAPQEIVFTSGGTESDNLAVRGVVLASQKDGSPGHVLTTPVEHPAVLRACRYLEARHGTRVELLPVDRAGRVDPDDVRRMLRDDTALVSVIFANNEIGTINLVREIGALCRERGVPFHSDAVQAAAHLPINVGDLNLDLLSIGAHKFYGPKGVGALYCRSGVTLSPIQPGGSQESGRRAGTENVPLIVGLAAALDLAREEMSAAEARSSLQRDRLIQGVLADVPGAVLTGHRSQRLPNHASFAIEGIDGNRLLAALDLAGYACSSGSACKTGDPEPSSVLLAIGLEHDLALGSLRVTVGRPTTDAVVDGFLATLPQVVTAQRERAAVAA
jgi:cysteine desulfurase